MFAAAAIRSIPGFTEPFSSLSHLLGAGVFAVLGCLLLCRGRGCWGRFACLAVYAFAGVFLLSMSGVYHLLAFGGSGRAVLERLDHSAIFVLIAGSFTPAHGILFRGWARWAPLLLVWSAATVGIILKVIYLTAVPEWLGLSLYLGLGWMGAASAAAIWRRFGAEFVRPLLLGGAMYTLGGVLEFARWPVLVPGVVGPHELMHLLVLAAVGLHWKFVYQFAAGPPRSEVGDHGSEVGGQESEFLGGIAEVKRLVHEPLSTDC
jgi:channel protein (hemolysin III family)